MSSDLKRLFQACGHIERIKEGTYPQVVGDTKDGTYRIVERPWAQVPEPKKLAILQGAVDWSGVTDRDKAHILLGEIDPGKITDAQRDRLVRAADAPEKVKQADRGMEL
ncbi:MAG: hypothetical protein K8U57_21565 [Planctomycetes bacterium]|nr:hypothetical protein [Planctomycetota bacterium]